jgi:hypothetical protein
MADAVGRSARSMDDRRSEPLLFVPGDELQVDQLTDLWFGRELNQVDFRQIAGNLPETNVLVGLSDGLLTIETWGEDRWPIWALFHLQKHEKQILLFHDCIRAFLPPKQRVDMVEHIFLAQRRIALRFGIDSIRHRAEPNHPFGTYEYWPSWGFDAILPDLIRDELPLELERVRRVSELMRTKQGRLWCRQYRKLESLDLVYDFNLPGVVSCKETGRAFGEEIATTSDSLPVIE